MTTKGLKMCGCGEPTYTDQCELCSSDSWMLQAAPKQPEAKHSWHNTNEWKLDATVTNQQLLNYVNATDKKEAQKWSLLVDLTKFLNSLQETK